MNLFVVVFSFFKKFFGAIFGAALGSSLAKSLVDLAKDAVGKLAIDAVMYVEAVLPGGSDADKRAAALTKLKADLTSAGKDLEQFSDSLLNLLVELGVQYVKKYLPSTEATTVTDLSENHPPLTTAEPTSAEAAPTETPASVPTPKE